MPGSMHRQASLFYVAFGREASLIKDDLLAPIDSLLDDEAMVELVAVALRKRHPLSAKTGRRGIAPDRLLRLAVLKHIKSWSLRQLEREVRGSLVYRRFCRFDHDPIPDFSSLSRQLAALGDDVIGELHARVVAKARSEKVAVGRKLRTDTTVVETNVHYPTDSTLLQDCVRVLGRSLQRIAKQCSNGSLKVRDRSRAAKLRVIEIARAAKKLTEDNKQRMKAAYIGLLAITAVVLRQAKHTIDAVSSGALKCEGGMVAVERALGQLQHFAPLTERVVAQTKARVIDGNTHHTGKLLSIFETHTQVIRKGKPHKPAEFGRLVRFDEVENGIISNFEVNDGNPADSTQFLPAIDAHLRTFECAPKMAAADRGYFSAENEKQASARGVKHVVLPARGKLSKGRAKHQKRRWFRKGQGFRVGIESRIATLKHRFGLVRAHYKDDRGFKRNVGWGVVANNLVSIARAKRKKIQQQKRK